MPSTAPELMSPAGYWPELKAAVESGADAVYFGLNHFSARAKVGFTLDELPEVMKMLHGRQVKGFVTCNTLVFDHELAQAEEAIMAIAGSGVDAVIVQDVGICQLIRSIAPDLEIHGSTQMSVTSAEGAEFAKSLGCSRIVLGRELSLDEIRKISQSTDIELEVFVHGALCVSYSGQCFSSEAWGGRSANRGKCAQACRLSYDLIVDGRPRDLGPYRYLLSPGDLCTVDQIPDLIQAGIACVKIEGRYKDASYVALTTRAYRRAIDLAMKGIPNELNSDERRDLEQIYSRGLGAHFMSGTNHQKVVRGRAPRHRGVQMGVVCEVRKYSVVVRFDNLIRRGDGLVFDSADWKSPDEPEEGGNVYEVRQLGHGQLELEFGKGEIEFQQIRIGDLVWRTKDPSLQRGLKTILRSEKPVFTRPVSFQVFAEPGQPLQVEASTANGCRAQFVGDEPLQPAKKRGLELDTLNEKLGRLGGTPFHIQTVLWSPQKPVFVPASLLNMARRQLINDLMVQLEAVKRPVAQRRFDEIRTKLVQKSVESIRESSADLGVLHLLVRNPSQLDAALAVATNRPIGSITLDYLELKGLRLAVKKIKQQGQHPRVAAPRILKPGEENIVRALLSLDCDLLIRSSGFLFDLKRRISLGKLELGDRKLIGDFSLNIANLMTAWKYRDEGLSRITPTYDLNSQQISELCEAFPSDRMEAIAYSHLPVFHTEHCVFCRFLSDGTDYTNCGHPCEKHQVSVRDSLGRPHPVMADSGCRNTVFGAQAQTDPRSLEKWINCGIRHFRVEFVHQSESQVKEISTAFLNYFDQQIDTSGLATVLSASSPEQTTEGSLFVPRKFQQLVQLS